MNVRFVYVSLFTITSAEQPNQQWDSPLNTAE